ncbi:MAG: DPP IV N-terminal domain-containing protein [Myxococcaceae bacterium]
MTALLTLAFFASTTAMADTASDEFLTQYAETGRFLFGRPNTAKLTSDGKAVLFLRSQPKSPEQLLYELELSTGKTRELLTPELVLKGAVQTLSVAERARLERMRISARGITSYVLSKDSKQLALTLSGRLYVVQRASGKVLAVRAGEGVLDPQFSPDGRLIAYVRDHELHVVALKENASKQVTKGGSPLLTHGLPEFVAQEEMGRFAGYWWSPDSKSLAFEEADTSGVEQLAIVDVMKPEKGSDLFSYPRPGKTNARVKLGVVAASGGAVKWVKWDDAKYPYLATVRWSKNAPLTVLVQARSQQEQLLLAVDEETGKTRTLLEEKDQAWLNLDQDFPEWLPDGKSFFWRTERNGGPEIEERSKTGVLVKSWVKPEAGLGSYAGFDAKSKTLYFTGSPNPTEQMLHRVREGEKPERLSKEPSWEEAIVSDEGGLLLVHSTNLTRLPGYRVLNAELKELAELPSVGLEPPFKPRVEIQKVGQGDGFYASVIRPRQLPAGKKLPVLVEVYGGPHHQEVKHTFREYLLSQWYADQGYVVVKIDGRGTPRRGRVWERAIRGDFATNAVADQVAGLQAVAAKLPEADLNRVGIQGWSFGGYMSALAVLRRPDVFHVGVAGAPVVDWLDYDTHYTERYLGVPEGTASPAYQVSSLLTYAKDLNRPLLIVHGTADDNVYFFHSLKLSDALFRAGKRHELLALSGLTHMVPDPLVTVRLHQRIADEFGRALK